MLVLLLLLMTSAAMANKDYIKGAIDVARCRASCSDKFLPAAVVSDSSCRNSPDCNMCWQTCGYLFENYFLWVDMCNDFIICLPGCRQACSFWDDVKSAGFPAQDDLEISVYAVQEIVLFQWKAPPSPPSNMVFVLRTFSKQRAEWIVLSQTLDNSCTVQKHYINTESKYQLVVVTQNKVIAVSNIVVDLKPATTAPPAIQHALNQTLETAIDPPVVSNVMPAVFSTLAVVCIICCAVVIYFMVKRYRQRQEKLNRIGSIRSHSNLTRMVSVCQDKTIDYKRIRTSETLIQGEFGLTISKGFYGPVSVYIKAIEGPNMVTSENHRLLLDMSKFIHIGNLPGFLSVVGVYRSERANVLLIERMLEFCSLTHYLKSCYRDGEIVNNAIHSFIPCGQVKVKTELSAESLLSIIYQLAVTMENLSELDYIHKNLNTDYIMINPTTKEIKLVDAELWNEMKITERSCDINHFLSPESLSCQTFSLRSDLWSFGSLIFQIIRFGETPYEYIRTDDLYAWLCQANRPGKPANCSNPLYELILSCWSIFPEQRPSFSHITESLAILLEDSEIHLTMTCKASEEVHCVIEMCDTGSSDASTPATAVLHHRAITKQFSFLETFSNDDNPSPTIAKSLLSSHVRLNAVSDIKGFFKSRNALNQSYESVAEDDVFDDDVANIESSPLSTERLKSSYRFTRQNSLPFKSTQSNLRGMKTKLRRLVSSSNV